MVDKKKRESYYLQETEEYRADGDWFNYYKRYSWSQFCFVGRIFRLEAMEN
jgi:hypothetical protein